MTNGQTIEVNTWEELQRGLFEDDWAPGLQRFRSSYVYRGLEDSRYNLTTSLNRQGESHLERHLLRNFKKYSQLSNPPNSEWHWMALAQHHGLPTRLLDWSYSPLVALHFATADHAKYDRDSIIWAVNYVDCKRYLPDQLSSVVDREGSYILTTDMLDQATKNLEGLSAMRERPFPVFFEPPSIDGRIVNQYAVFSMMSDPNIRIDDWLLESEVRWFKIKIPRDLLWQARDRLDQANLTERVLFPGLGGLATWLRRHYKDTRKSQQDGSAQPFTRIESK